LVGMEKLATIRRGGLQNREVGMCASSYYWSLKGRRLRDLPERILKGSDGSESYKEKCKDLRKGKNTNRGMFRERCQTQETWGGMGVNLKKGEKMCCF